MTTIDVKDKQILRVGDYHEFANIEFYLKNFINPDYEVYELSRDFHKQGDLLPYYGLISLGKMDKERLREYEKRVIDGGFKELIT